jgi:hypothetical protein
MRKLIIISAILLASASAHAQSLDVGSALSANGISMGSGTDQSQLGSALQGGAAQEGGAGSQAGAGPQGSKRHATGHARQSHSGTRESADETKARRIAAKYGVSW